MVTAYGIQVQQHTEHFVQVNLFRRSHGLAFGYKKVDRMKYLKSLLNYVKKMDETKPVCLGLKKLGPRGMKVV